MSEVCMNRGDERHPVMPTERVLALTQPLGQDGLFIGIDVSGHTPESARLQASEPVFVVAPEGHVQGLPYLTRLGKRTRGQGAGMRLHNPVVTDVHYGNELHVVDGGRTNVRPSEHGRQVEEGRNAGALIGGILHKVDEETGQPLTPTAHVYLPAALFDLPSYLRGLGEGIGNRAYRPMGDHLKAHPGEVEIDGVLEAAPALTRVMAAIRHRTQSIAVIYPGEAVASNAFSSGIEAMKGGERIARLKALVRFLAELPPNILTTEVFVRVAHQLVTHLRETFNLNEDELGIEIYSADGQQLADLPSEDETLEALRMNSVLAIHGGSTMPGPYFVRIKYRHPSTRADAPVNVTAWKTVIFDDGGRNPKGFGAKHMKDDITAGADGLATLVGIVEACSLKNFDFCFAVQSNENGHGARRSGDVWHAASGRTIVEGDPDAEGRESLGDALAVGLRLARQEGRTLGHILTAATLTYLAGKANQHRLTVVGERDLARRVADLATDEGELATATEWDWHDFEAAQGKITDAVNQPEGPEAVVRGHVKAAAIIATLAGVSQELAERMTHVDLGSRGHGHDSIEGLPNDTAHAEFPGAGEGVALFMEWARKVAA